MAHTVSELEAAGLVKRVADRADKRQTLIELTPAGVSEMEAFSQKGESWVADAIAANLTQDEVHELARGIELLGRLVEE
jgi:DNA-binding MarR family transcriptional regulator